MHVPLRPGVPSGKKIPGIRRGIFLPLGKVLDPESLYAAQQHDAQLLIQVLVENAVNDSLLYQKRLIHKQQLRAAAVSPSFARRSR